LDEFNTIDEYNEYVNKVYKLYLLINHQNHKQIIYYLIYRNIKKLNNIEYIKNVLYSSQCIRIYVKSIDLIESPYII